MTAPAHHQARVAAGFERARFAQNMEDRIGGAFSRTQVKTIVVLNLIVDVNDVANDRG